MVVNVILFIAFIMCIFCIAFYLWTLRKSKTLKVDTYMNDALKRLRSLPDGAVICLPQHWHDVVSYKSAKPVLYGAHGYGFKLADLVFPRFTKPVSYLINRFNVKYLLTYEGYLPENFLQELPAADIEEFGQYRLYRF